MSDSREAELLSRIDRLTKKNQLLQERIDQLLRKIYGAKSEKADSYQLQFLLQELEAPGPALGKESSPEAIEIEPPRHRKISRKRSGPRLPEHLPVVEEILVPEAVQSQPEAWRAPGF
jgi:hypothetical protein